MISNAAKHSTIIMIMMSVKIRRSKHGIEIKSHFGWPLSHRKSLQPRSVLRVEHCVCYLYLTLRSAVNIAFEVRRKLFSTSLEIIVSLLLILGLI